MSISTKRGDAGPTGLAGGIRVPKLNIRVEACGPVDELNASREIPGRTAPSENFETTVNQPPPGVEEVNSAS